MVDDPFVLEPQVWFAVLCHGVNIDPVGRINLQAVFNQAAFFVPSVESGIQPHAHIQAVLALGFTGGEGRFETEIDLRDMDDRVLWQRPNGKWVFEVGLGQRPSALLAEQINVWLATPGRYHFWIRLHPGQVQHRIPFEVAEKIGPAQEQDAPPEAGESA
jgi:hypothetical protein